MEAGHSRPSRPRCSSCMLFTIPRSPRWLVKKQRVAEAREVLRDRRAKLRQANCGTSSSSIDAEQDWAMNRFFSASIGFRFFWPSSIGMFNQLAGINAILYYLNDIFA